MDDDVGLQPRQLRLEILGIHLVERIRGAERPKPVRGQRCVHVLACGEVHLVPGVSCGDRQRDQRVGVTDRRQAGKQDAHAKESTAGEPRASPEMTEGGRPLRGLQG
jgi:hypothetical protein